MHGRGLLLGFTELASLQALEGKIVPRRLLARSHQQLFYGSPNHARRIRAEQSNSAYALCISH
jgi:hypothetical protein